VSIRHVTVCDSLPGQLAFVRANPRSHSSAGRRCWSIASLGARKTTTLALVANTTPGRGGRLRNIATVGAPGVRTVRASAVVTERRTPPIPPALQS
jgi:Domain of unknown function DUF11